MSNPYRELVHNGDEDPKKVSPYLTLARNLLDGQHSYAMRWWYGDRWSHGQYKHGLQRIDAWVDVAEIFDGWRSDGKS